ncbi:hypothetical protein IFT64_18825 [Oxalobacteraceae sp. CFBP 8753]|nr:hypothetical protein [Oxalobacteraceae sp. CFBP 8753]
MNLDQIIPSRAVRGNQSKRQAGQHPTRLASMVAALVSAGALSACGGGGGADADLIADARANASVVANSSASAAVTTPGFTPKPTAPAILPPVLANLNSTTPPAIIAGNVITDIELQNQGAARTRVPFTFGQIVAVGQFSKTDGLAARLSNGTLVRLQADVKATHADGSVRHMIVSGVLPTLAAGQIEKIELVKTKSVEATPATLSALASAGLTGSVNLTLNGVQYSASLADALTDPKAVHWLSGSIANEWIVSAPLKTATNVAHPLLSASFAVRWYPGLEKQARVDVIVENTKTFTAGARNLTYDVNINVGGREIYAKTGLVHYHHSRWHQSTWWDAATTPQVHARHNTAYLVASKAISNYDLSVAPAETLLANFVKELPDSKTGPMTAGPVMASMGTTGGRGDIGPLPVWTVAYLLSKDQRALTSMMAAADGSATWSIHMRDEKTGMPLRVDNEAYKNVSTHMNLAKKGPLPVPRCADNNNSLCASPFQDDTAHQPSMVYLPYLLTGDYYYLEELQFWAAWNPLGTDPGNSGYGKGLVRWQQVRGQGWSLRTLGHVAYITPDAHPLKDYFVKQIDNNLAFYHDTYVVGNPNQLGMFDGSGTGANKMDTSAPWQDDFFTWSFGYLAELGFSKAEPILKWKSTFPVGRMTDPGFCWIEATAYHLVTRVDAKSPVYNSFADLYAANFGGKSIRHDVTTLVHPNGVPFMSQQCGSQAQADWITTAMGRRWTLGRMSGYSDSPLGYPANMQPALAVAAVSGIPNAGQAWATFAGRADKQNYAMGPQWNIIPR